MININSKEWAELAESDIVEFLSSPETEESFFFEFKDDRVNSKKVAEEISALANTYGGYIFLGVSDDKKIEGCTAWNEQRIQTTIHDSITPTPSFDVKKFVCENQIVFVIRIDEGAEPPYITSQGKIYERLSSGSCVVKDSARLTQMYNKQETRLQRLMDVLSIPPISADVGNIYGYIDIGFSLTLSDPNYAIKTLNDVDLETIAQDIRGKYSSSSLYRFASSIVFVPGGLSAGTNKLPAHLNNFMEIMRDGNVRMRLLLMNNNAEEETANMIYPFFYLGTYRTIYARIMGSLFPEYFIFAKGYESLTTLKQFQPIFRYEPDMLTQVPAAEAKNDKYLLYYRERQKIYGINRIITNDRIPKTGLLTIDKSAMQKWGVKKYTSDSIIDELFYSQFVYMSIPKEL